MGKQRTIEDWQLILAQFQVSGLSVAQFCKQHKLASSNFYKWRKRVEQLATTDITSQVAVSNSTDNWQAITFDTQVANTQQWDIELTLPGGVTLNMRATT